jgi:hypothetical protein
MSLVVRAVFDSEFDRVSALQIPCRSCFAINMRAKRRSNATLRNRCRSVPLRLQTSFESGAKLLGASCRSYRRALALSSMRELIGARTSGGRSARSICRLVTRPRAKPIVLTGVVARTPGVSWESQHPRPPQGDLTPTDIAAFRRNAFGSVMWSLEGLTSARSYSGSAVSWL